MAPNRPPIPYGLMGGLRYTAMATCIACLEPMNDGATRCPHCTATQTNPADRQVLTGMWILAGLLIAGIAVIIAATIIDSM